MAEEKAYDNRFEVPSGTEVHMEDILTDKGRDQIKVGMVMKMKIIIEGKEELRTLRVVKNSPKEGFVVEVINNLMTIDEAASQIAKRKIIEIGETAKKQPKRSK